MPKLVKNPKEYDKTIRTPKYKGPKLPIIKGKPKKKERQAV